MQKLTLTVAAVIMLVSSVNAQEAETLIGPGTDFGYAFVVDLKTSSIQDELGTLIGIGGGVIVNRSTLLGLTVGANVSHPKVNYSYFGLLAQYSLNPNKAVHYSGQVLLAGGSTKDYEQKKSSLMDNFLNTTGAGFYLIEPGVNVELNLTGFTRLVAGVSYRIVTGLNADSEHVKTTGITNSDLSGLNVNIGVKLGTY